MAKTSPLSQKHYSSGTLLHTLLTSKYQQDCIFNSSELVFWVDGPGLYELEKAFKDTYGKVAFKTYLSDKESGRLKICNVYSLNSAIGHFLSPGVPRDEDFVEYCQGVSVLLRLLLATGSNIHVAKDLKVTDYQMFYAQGAANHVVISKNSLVLFPTFVKQICAIVDSCPLTVVQVAASLAEDALDKRKSWGVNSVDRVLQLASSAVLT